MLGIFFQKKLGHGHVYIVFAECEISHTHTSALMRPLHVLFKLHQRTLTVSGSCVGCWTARSPLSSTGNNPKLSSFVTHEYLVQRSVYSVTWWLRASYWPYVTCEANRLQQLINIFHHFYQNLKLKKPFQENEIKKLCLVLRKLQEGDACAAGCENECFPHIVTKNRKVCSVNNNFSKTWLLFLHSEGDHMCTLTWRRSLCYHPGLKLKAAAQSASTWRKSLSRIN